MQSNVQLWSCRPQRALLYTIKRFRIQKFQMCNAENSCSLWRTTRSSKTDRGFVYVFCSVGAQINIRVIFGFSKPLSSLLAVFTLIPPMTAAPHTTSAFALFCVLVSFLGIYTATTVSAVRTYSSAAICLIHTRSADVMETTFQYRANPAV